MIPSVRRRKTAEGTQWGEDTDHGNTGLQDHGNCRQPNRALKLEHLKPEAKPV
jgi:hypothetical protein